MALVFTVVPTIGWSQQPTLGELAAREEQRRKSITEPSKVYTIIDLDPDTRRPRANGVLSSCPSEEKHDPQTGNTYRILRCPDGTTTELGSNSRTGTEWHNKYFLDGSMEGIDSCGNRWTYDAATTVYVTENGEKGIGLGDFRKRLNSHASCDANRRKNILAAVLDRRSEARKRLARAQAFQAALVDRIDALDADLENRDDPVLRATIEADREKALAEPDRVKSAIEQYRWAVFDIEEELRRAGRPREPFLFRDGQSIPPNPGSEQADVQPGSLVNAARAAAARERCLKEQDENARMACLKDAGQK